jgi:hypothetical protein
MKRVLYSLIAVLIVIAAYAASALFLRTDAGADLQKIARGEQPSGIFLKADLICFNDNNGSEFNDFKRAAERAGSQIDEPYGGCGTDRSCCEMNVTDSARAGAVGLVRDRKITCVSTGHENYLLENAREVCVKPDRLKVTAAKFQKAFDLSGRPWAARVGGAYLSIEER